MRDCATNDVCVDCGGLVTFGEVHDLKVETKMNGQWVSRIQTRCVECSQIYAEAMWPEDWGPYKHPPRMRAGKC